MCTDTHTGPGIPGLHLAELNGNARQAESDIMYRWVHTQALVVQGFINLKTSEAAVSGGLDLNANSQSTGSGANPVKGQRETYIKWQPHLSPALTSIFAHAVERRLDCGALCDELGCACICVLAVALSGAFNISDVEYWSEMDDDLVGVGFFSCRLLFFSWSVSFSFWEGTHHRAAWTYHVWSPRRSFSRSSAAFCGSYQLYQLVVDHSAHGKAEFHELASSGRSCVGQVPSGSMFAE